MSSNAMNECFSCIHQRRILGDCHISCSNPDPAMKGNPHAISQGWFWYPFNFDPTWKLKPCSNYENRYADEAIQSPQS